MEDRTHIPQKCETCGAEFFPWRGREKTSRYCSRKCNGAGHRVSLETRKEEFWKGVIKHPGNGCWEWTGSKKESGYGTIVIHGGRYSAHRLSYEMAFGEIPDGLVIRHSCDNPSCVRPNHLLSGTQKDNVADMWERGRANNSDGSHIAGEKHPLSKLTAEQVLAIRQDERSGKKIAWDYDVCPTLIQNIKHRRTWKHI